MQSGAGERGWFWVTLGLSCVTIAGFVFAVSELVEYKFFSQLDYVTLHYLYISRGVGSSLLLAFWAAWFVLRDRRRSELELRRSRERYRGLLEASPEAVALYDSALRVVEWNATAERLYGFGKPEAIGAALATVPAGKEEELRQFMQDLDAGKAILDVETLRRDARGTVVDVRLSLLPFQEERGHRYYLEVTADMRERNRMRQKMLEIEKLTSMGQMAAGTAHHLNTPLASLLLRVQMMEEQARDSKLAADLKRLEAGIHSCRHFVQRLLEFTRRPPMEKQPTELAGVIESVVGFLGPALATKRARVTLELDPAGRLQVQADRNLLEALFSILISNALDAIAAEGRISARCRRLSAELVEIVIADDGCGIAESDRPRIFEPFFTTKGPGKGTGLGLAIARNIVLDHGGSLRLENLAGGGAAAVLELPVLEKV